ncbi:MAG TPA: ATP-binding protein [bacterium]|nr:ATP-binding protein [bacterium]
MTLLPKEKSKPKQSLADYVITIYGQEKIGKTTVASGFENAIILATEAGHNALSVFKIDIDNWEKFLDACRELAEGAHDFRTIVIDTVDNLWTLCRQHVCEKHKIEHEADMPYGKGYALILNEFHRVLTKLSMLPYGLVLISHAQAKEVQTRTGAYSKIVPSLPDRPRKLILAMSDMILFFDQDIVRADDSKQSIRRVIRTQPHPSFEAGDRTGRLPAVLDLNYDAFAQAFSGKPTSEAKTQSTTKKNQ